MRSSSRWLTLSECGSRFHVHDAACWYVASLRWFTEVDRQRSGEHDERFLLGRMAVAFARRARLIAPHVRANVSHARHLAELGHVPGRLTVGVRPRFPALLIRRDDAGTHRRRMTPVLRTRRPPCGARRADSIWSLAAGRRRRASRSRGGSGRRQRFWAAASRDARAVWAIGLVRAWEPMDRGAPTA